MPTITSDWTDFSTFANETSVGSASWTNPGNAITSNDTYASRVAAIGSNFDSHYLKATAPSISLSPDAVIVGIEVRVEQKKAGGLSTVVDNSVRIVKGGTITGTDQSAGAAWTTADTYATFGSSTDLWGTAWTPSDFGSGFGVVVSVHAQDVSIGATTLYIDHIQFRVTYTSGGMMAAF